MFDALESPSYRAAVAPNVPIRKPLAAGQEIDAWCTRCKLDLGHRIVAMVDRTPKRVICMTCGSEHNYRAPKTAPVASKTPRATAPQTAAQKAASPPKKPTSRAQVRAEWETQVRSGRPFRRYAATDTFNAGDLLQHKKFGDGYVREVVGKDKVIVVFADGDRTLVHGLPD